MTGTVQAGCAVLALVWVAGCLLIRWALTGGQPAKHRAPRPRRLEVLVPGHHLIPALAYGAAASQAIAHCNGCGHAVPVTVHGDTRSSAHLCQHNHITIHATGEAA